MRRALYALALVAGAAQAGHAELPCVDTLAKASALPLPPFKPGKAATRKFDFARASACLAGGDTRQRVLVFALGDYAPPLALGIESLPRRGAMLAPEVRIYDRDGRQLAAYPFAAFSHRGEVFALTVFLNDAAASGGRVVIAADPASVGRKTTLLSADAYYMPMVSAVAIWNFVGAGEGRRETAFAEAGTVRLRVESGEPRPLK